MWAFNACCWQASGAQLLKSMRQCNGIVVTYWKQKIITVLYYSGIRIIDTTNLTFHLRLAKTRQARGFSIEFAF